MENPIYSSPMQSQRINQGLVFFLAGAENKLVSQQEKRTILMLAVCSIASATLYAFAFGWIVESKSNFMVLSSAAGLAVFSCLILLNRTTFLFSYKNSKSITFSAIGFIVVHLILSYWIIPQPMTYYFLQADILKNKTTDTAIGEFSAMLRVIEQLNINERRALQHYRFLCSSIVFVFSLLPLLVNYLMLRNETNEIQLKQDFMRKQIEALLVAKKMEYSTLFSVDTTPKPVSDDPFALEDDKPVLTDEQRFERADILLKEINHLRQSLQHLL